MVPFIREDVVFETDCLALSSKNQEIGLEVVGRSVRVGTTTSTPGVWGHDKRY